MKAVRVIAWCSCSLDLELHIELLNLSNLQAIASEFELFLGLFSFHFELWCYNSIL